MKKLFSVVLCCRQYLNADNLDNIRQQQSMKKLFLVVFSCRQYFNADNLDNIRQQQ